MKRFILFTYLLFISSSGFAGSVTKPPTIDFGSMGYILDSTDGFNTVTISATGAVSTGETGPLTGLTGGSAGTAIIGNFSWLESLFGSTVTFQTNRSTVSTTITTAGCGSVVIDNFTTTGGATSATGSARNDSESFPLGAKLTLSSFSGSGGCTISGTVSGPVQFRVGNTALGTNWTNVPVDIIVRIEPRLSLRHDQNAALDFGNICRSSTQQTITVRADGTATPTNTLCPLTTTHADSFTVTGNTGQSFDVSLPATASISNGSDTLTIDNFTSSCTTNCVLENGAHTFTVGGTLTVPGGSSVGEYTGSYPVSITY